MPKGPRTSAEGRLFLCQIKNTQKEVSVRVLCGDFQRGDGFQAGLDVLLLSTVPNTEVKGFLLSSQLVLASDVLSSCLKPVDRSLPTAATLALAALGSWHQGRGDISGGGRRRLQHLEPSNRNDGKQTVGLLLGVKREVAEDVRVMRTGSTWKCGSQAAPLIQFHFQGCLLLSHLHLGLVSGLIAATSVLV